MLILSLLGMDFEAVVVIVTNSSLFSDLLWPYCEWGISSNSVAFSKCMNFILVKYPVYYEIGIPIIYDLW